MFQKSSGKSLKWSALKSAQKSSSTFKSTQKSSFPPKKFSIKCFEKCSKKVLFHTQSSDPQSFPEPWIAVLTFDIGWGLVPGYYCLNEHSRKQKWMLMLEYSSFIFFSAVQFIKICGGNLYKKTAERLRFCTLAALINWRLVSNHRIIFFNIISWL